MIGRPPTRVSLSSQRRGLRSLIADDFVEFGRSGRTWTRDSFRAGLEGQPGAPVPIDQFEVARLADAVALVTWRGAMANRSSIWAHRYGRWQVRFHQGTPFEVCPGRVVSPSRSRPRRSS